MQSAFCKRGQALTRLACVGLLAASGAAAQSQTLYVNDDSLNAILTYNETTGAFTGSLGFRGNEGLVFGPDGGLYTGTNNAIYRYNPATGVNTLFIASVTPGGFTDFAFGPNHNLYAVGNGSIVRYDGRTGAFLGTFAADAGLGTHAPDGVQHLAFGPDGNLYVTTSAGVVRYNGQTGAFLGVFVPNSAADSVYLTFGPDGSLYTDGARGNTLQNFDGVTGALRYQVNGGEFPQGLAFGPDNLLYIGNAENRLVFSDSFTIQRFDPSAQTLTTFVPQSSGGLADPTYLAFSPFAVPVAVPEPGSGALLMGAFFAAAGLLARRKRAAYESHSENALDAGEGTPYNVSG